MKIGFCSNTAWSLYNFRLSLITDLRQEGHEIFTFSAYDNHSKYFTKNHFNFTSNNRSLNPLSFLRDLIDSYNAVKRNGIDLLICFTVRTSFSFLLINSLINKPMLISITGLGFLTQKSITTKLFIFVFRAIAYFTRKKVFCFQTNYDRNFFIERSLCSEASSFIIPGSGVDLSKFTPSLIEKDTLNFLHCSRLLHSKGVIEYCESARLLSKRYPNHCKFFLAGELITGSDAIKFSEIEPFIQEGSIIYEGFTDDVNIILNKIDVVVLMTRYSEGIPKSLIEAAAAGKIIVTTSQDGCKEVVKDGVNGFIIDYEMLDSTLIKIKNMSSKEKLKFGKSSRNLAISKYSIDSINAKYIAILRTLLP